ncbi:MAG: hypothetical protein LW833_07740, partial [Hyphomicrobiales bacterium]|nr:hypothetical protein [Hyphomicrobiales bacterium]
GCQDRAFGFLATSGRIENRAHASFVRDQFPQSRTMFSVKNGCGISQGEPVKVAHPARRKDEGRG